MGGSSPPGKLSPPEITGDRGVPDPGPLTGSQSGPSAAGRPERSGGPSHPRWQQAHFLLPSLDTQRMQKSGWFPHQLLRNNPSL